MNDKELLEIAAQSPWVAIYSHGQGGCSNVSITLPTPTAKPPVEPVAEYVVRTDAKGKTGGICYLRPAAYDLKEGSYLLYTSMPPAKMLTVDEIRRIADKSDEGQEQAEFMLAFARGIEAAVLRGAGLK